jgi:hypothetical protein
MQRVYSKLSNFAAAFLRQTRSDYHGHTVSLVFSYQVTSWEAQVLIGIVIWRRNSDYKKKALDASNVIMTFLAGGVISNRNTQTVTRYRTQ